MNDQVKQFIALDKTKRELKDQLKHIESQMASLEEPVLSHMQDTGTQRLTCDGLTVHINRRVFASCVDMEALQAYPESAALVAPACNAMRLTSWVNELDKDDQLMPILPDEIKDAIKVSETYKLGTRVSK